MSDGIPLPWPFPWSIQPNLAAFSVSTSAASQARYQAAPLSDADPAVAVWEEASKLLSEFGGVLPEIKTVELYLIRALAEIQTGQAKELAVIYPPEFLYVLDVGTESLVGGFFTWKNVYFGDPVFPAKQTPEIRSIASRDSGQLIFPKVPGEIMLGVVEGTPHDEVVKVLTAKGIKDIEFFDFFLTARCQPFGEHGICAELESTVPFVRYAQPNRIVRLIDFSPGWHVTRLT